MHLKDAKCPSSEESELEEHASVYPAPRVWTSQLAVWGPLVVPEQNGVSATLLVSLTKY